MIKRKCDNCGSPKDLKEYGSEDEFGYLCQKCIDKMLGIR